MFISFEGIDGCGKTTQVNLLKEHFERQGEEVVLVKEPGGEVGSYMWQLIKGDEVRIDAFTEFLLFAAGRRHLVNTTIYPALQQGKIVIADRYYDSSLAYQHLACPPEESFDRDVAYAINDEAIYGFKPHITFLITAPLDVAKQRLNTTHEELDRIESKDDKFFKRVDSAYRALARVESNRWRVVDNDGTRPPADVHKHILTLI